MLDIQIFEFINSLAAQNIMIDWFFYLYNNMPVECKGVKAD